MKRSSIFIAVFICISIAIFPQVFTNFKAKKLLREWGIYADKIIQDAETITISGGSIIWCNLMKSVDNAIRIWRKRSKYFYLSKGVWWKMVDMGILYI